jgi:uncharacterized protein
MQRSAPVFVDTAYVLALISHRDQWHQQAARWSRQLEDGGVALVTTEFVLTEVGNALASVIERRFAVETIRTFQASEYVEIVPASRMLFEAGLDLYASRTDKDWGLTDCTSFEGDEGSRHRGRAHRGSPFSAGRIPRAVVGGVDAPQIKLLQLRIQQSGQAQTGGG